MRRSEADAELFRNFCRAADAEFDPIKRCQRYSDIGRYWPIARRFGAFFWDEEAKLWRREGAPGDLVYTLRQGEIEL